MDPKHKELLQIHRSKFSLAVDVDRLCPILEEVGILTQNDVAEIRILPTKAGQIETLLDILPSKGPMAFEALCSALETTYPHLLTVMFLGSNQKVTGSSRSTSLTWESEDEAPCDSPQPGDHQVATTSPKTYTRIIPSYVYDIQPHELPSSNEHLNVKSEPKLPSHTSDMQKTRSNQKSGSLNEERQRDYDWLKSQCEKAMNELQSLKRQHGDTVKRCDQAMKEAEFYRRNYKSGVGKLDQATEEIDAVKTRCNEVILEKNKLSQELGELRRLHEEDKSEIAILLKQQRDVISEGAPSEVLKLYDSAQDKYEALRKDYENLQKRFADQLGEYSTAANKLELTVEENARLKKQYEDAISERNCALMERNGLKQQCTAAIRNWDIAIQERNKIKGEFENAKRQEDNLAKEIRQIMHGQLKAKQDFERVCEERNAALHEYKLVMSERDSVHKEIEQLQDRLQEAVKEVETLRRDKKTLQDERESLKREINSALQDRDKALKEVNDLREKYGDVCSEKNEVLKERDEFRKDYYIVAQERDVARHERQEALVHRDQILRETYEKTAREKAEEMEQVAKETEALKKLIEKLQQDFMDSVQEADIAKKRRDWAFGERDKIVQERESIRTLCDKLRRERDRAVSDLAQALRDSDDLKKQKNEMYKELKELRERYESVMESDVRKSQLNSVSHNHSRDSAIDADLHEWETETLELDLGGINSQDVGFELVGGKDDPQFPNDNSLFVSHVTKGSAVDGKLKLNDLLVKVNNIDVTNVEKQVALQAVINSSLINMVVRRKKSSNRSYQPVQLSINLGKDPGVQLESGLFVSRISPNSSIAKERALNLGDRILAVNGQSVDKMTIPSVLKVMGESSENVVLDIWKPTSPVSSAGPSPTPANQSLPRELPVTPPMRKAVTENHLWENRANCGSSESKSTSNLKALKCSGSQTDSLDSPSPRKKHHEHKEDNKARHGSHHDWLKFLRIFLSKNHEDRERMNKSNSGMSSAEEDVIAEFDNVLDNCDLVKAKSGKVADPKTDINNGGTWPKTHHAKLDFPGPGTVIECQHNRRERPRLPPEFLNHHPHGKIPPDPPERTNSSVDATFRHSPQNSDIPVKNSAPSLVSPHGRQLPMISSPIKLPISPSHSSGPRIQDSRGSHYPAYSTPVSPDNPGRHRELLPLYLDRKMKAMRPTSAPGRGDKRYPMPISSHYPGAKPAPLDISMFYPPQAPPYSPIRSALSPTDFLPRGPDRPAGQHYHAKATSPINFPTSVSPLTKGSLSLIQSYPNGSYSLESSHLPMGSQLMTSPQSGQPLVSPPGSAGYCSPPPGAIPNPNYFRDLSNPRMADMPVDRYLPAEKRVTISPSPSQQSSIGLDRSTPTPSEDFPYSHIYHRPSPNGRPLSGTYDGRSTIPRRAQERIRIPSNASMVAKSSTGSVEYVPERGSPMSQYYQLDIPERVSSSSLSNSLPLPVKPRKPLPGEQRVVNIEKTSDVVGFQIKLGPTGGIFVSSVNENSLASQAGLEIGDQLIEVCGINMRKATKDLAASVLRQCRDNFTMVLQFNPDKYNGESSESSTPSSPIMSHPNSPSSSRSLPKHLVSNETLTGQPISLNNASRMNGVCSTEGALEPRFVFLERSTPSMDLGIEIIGGNAAGIFVHEVEPGSAASGPQGLQRGDHILEFNGVDLRSATLEQACSELSKGNSKVTILAQYNIAKYNKICPGMGDFFYIRTHFDRTAENEGELSFKKDEILLIETTRFKEVGVWFGWLVDDEGKKIKGGSLPSKFRLEDDMVLRRSLSESLSLYEDDFRPSSRRGSNSVRRSIFRKRRHQRNNSKDSRDFGSFSDASLNSDSVPVLDDGSLYTYTKVERLEYTLIRPVILLAPLAEPIIMKLTSESPDKYCCCPTGEMSVQAWENGVSTGQFVEYWKRDDHYECITVSAVQAVCDKKCHCLLSVTPAAVERLRQVKIYPIVLFCRHKSAKQIRDIRDVQFLSERVSNRSAKDLFEQYQKLEQEHRHLFTAVIQGGNLAEMCTQIKRVIAAEQLKTIWVTAGTL